MQLNINIAFFLAEFHCRIILTLQSGAAVVDRGEGAKALGAELCCAVLCLEVMVT